MRLLRFEDSGKLSLVEHVGRDIPPYAILSHTWGADSEEVTFRDLTGGTGSGKVGHRKLTFCGKQARTDNIQYFWVDTCCIDKSSSAELTEAINSMFQWYQNANKCYVYLSDVSVDSSVPSDIPSQQTWKQAFKESRWFTRGWTLQELIAPKSVEFFSAECQRLGTRTSLLQEIHDITGVPIQAFQETPLSYFSVDERMSWTEKRKTKREEDAAYCLLGIFNIHMPLIYGEGQTNAFIRLRREIQGFQEFTKDKPHDLQPVLSRRQPKQLRDLLLTLSLGKDFDVHDQSLANIPEWSRTMLKNKDAVGLSTSLQDRRGWTSKRKGKITNQVEMMQNAIDTLHHLVPPTKSEIHLLRRPSKLEDHISGSGSSLWNEPGSPVRSDEQIQGVQDGIQLLLDDLQYRSRVQWQNTVNEWLDVSRFSSFYDISQYYDKQVSSRLEGTCEWIFSHSAYQTWMSEDLLEKAARILWVCAPPGYGKTILCARLVKYFEDMQRFPVAYIFASPHAQSGGEPSHIIRSWIAQIAQLDLEALELVAGYSEAGQRASESTVWSIFEAIVSQDRVYVFILDGFDEYNRLDDARTEFLQKLKKATQRTLSRILIFSRDETDIKAELSPVMVQSAGHVMLECRISKEDVRHDISLFSKSVVERKLPKKDDDLKQSLAGQLVEKCEGMFLWVKLQQDQLRSGKNTKQLQNIVKNMPPGLIKTYERNWNAIQNRSPEERNRALAILRWTTFALRPLSVSEITEALIVEPNDNDGADLQLDELPDSIDDDYISSEIVDICGDLVEVRAQKPGDLAGTRTIHLIHASVREFLLSALLPQSGDPSKPVSETDQAKHHKDLATTCLAYLHCEDIWKPRGEQGTCDHDYTLIHYAARHWNLHVIVAGNDDLNLLGLVERFFNTENESFHNWRRYIESLEITTGDDQENAMAAATPLYYAALFGLTASMESIWTHDKTQLNTVGGEYGTPLQAVCSQGHELAFDLLIQWGANPNTQGGKFGVPINAAIAQGHKRMVQTFVRMGADLTLKDSMGQTPLYTAVLNGHSDIADLLIRAGAERNVTNKNGCTPLRAAASSGHLEVVKILLEKGVDIEAPDLNGWTALNSATSNGRLEIVKLLLEKGADVTVPEQNGWTPLNLASSHGYLEIVKLLLEKGADITVPNKNGCTPFNTVARTGHLEIFKLLLEKGADITVPSLNGWTPLYAAANYGRLEIVKLLLEKGADVTVPEKNGWTPLNAAASCGHLEIVQLLLERGADITVPSIDGWTPLYTAARDGHLEMVKLLLEKGADVTVLGKDSWTPLNAAASYGHLEIVKLLLENGADIDVPNIDGWTPLYAAADHGHLEIVKLLLEKGSDVTVPGKDGWTPLIAAAIDGHLEIVKLLLEKGADLTVPNIDGWTPLYVAVTYGHLEIVKLLLEKGADVTVPGKDGWTPLIAAASGGQLDVVKLLLEKGADITVPAGDGWTPLFAAASSGFVEVVKLLLDRGADITGLDKDGSKLLFVAARNGHAEVLELLLNSHADVNAPIDLYGSVLNLLAFEGHTDIFRTAHLRYHADVRLKDPYGRTALHLAARGGHIDTFQHVMSLGLEPLAEDANGDSLIRYASSSGSLEILNAVLDTGLKYLSRSGQWSPLHWACRTGKHEVVERLVNEGLRSKYVHVSHPEGQWSPISVAIFHGNEEMLRKLPASCRSLLDLENDVVQSHGKRHENFYCDGCFHVSG
jgi:ankyrin repeat protein